MIKYVDYYRHFGIRRAMQLVAPPILDVQRLSLPRESILHYLPEGSQIGIGSDDPLLRDATGTIYAEHVLELAEKRGNPRSSMVSLSKLVREYHRKYRKIRQLHDFDRMLTDKRSLVIENYAILPQLYRYPANIYRPYNKWFNIQATFWAKVGELALKTQRQQFLECRLPPLLPSRAMLLKGTSKLNTRILSLFPNPESLFILEIWKWLAGYREDSLIAKLPKEALDKMNLIWLESGKWVVINLGLLEQWRQPTKDEIAAGAADRRGVPAVAMANRFLRMLMFLFEQRTEAGSVQPLTQDVRVDQNDAGQVDMTPVPAVVDVPINGEDTAIVLRPGVTNLDDLPLDDIEETPENIARIDEIVAKDLEALDHLHVAREREVLEEEELSFDPTESGLEEPMLDVPALKDLTLKESLMAKANQYADMGLLSGAEYRRLQALSEAYTKLPDPYTGKGSLEEGFTVDLSELKIEPKKLAPHIDGVVDHSMLYSTLVEYDAKYIKHSLPKDVGNAVLQIQNAGVAVTGYTVAEHRDAMNHYEAHAIQLTPVRGKVSTVHFRLPKVGEDGTFLANGVKYRLAKQRGDDPIRKVNSSTVALTSYYGKIFVSRSEKKVSDYAGWVNNQIAVRGMDTSNQDVTQMMLANVYDSNHKVPRIYSILAQRFRSFTIGDLNLFFDYEVRDSMYHPDPKTHPSLSDVENKKMTLVGTWGKEGWPVVVGADNVFYKVVEDREGARGKGQSFDYKVLGTIEEILNLDVAKAPKEMAEIKIAGKLIPAGIFLAYEMGWDNLLKLLKVQPVRRLQSGEHAKLGPDEYAITFEDERLVFVKSSDQAGLILQGIASWNEALVNDAMHLYNRKTIYFNALNRMKLGARYLQEMDLVTDLFIDPITKERLKAANEPVTFVGLVLRACELLETDWSLDETDFEHSRIRGYERFAGTVYNELVKAVRVQRHRGVSNAPVELHPNAIWNAIQQDPAVRLVEESNPVHELKSQEEVTFAGTGGRSGRAMVGRTRIFHTNDLGVISESTKDSADVAITTFMTANPQLTDVRGSTKRFNEKDTGPASLISTSALLAPCADRDDPKRVNFISIQNSSTTFCRAQRPLPLRTGYERVVAHRTSDLFAATAKKDGVVTKVTPRVVEVTHGDGTVRAIQIGRRFGNVAGLTIPHELKAHVKEGDKFKEGDLLAFNSHFFEVDPLDKKQGLMKAGVLMNTALLESPETLEDSSTISVEAAKLLETQITKIRDIVVTFDQSIHGLVSAGTHVEADSILCTIEDPITADHRFFDETSLDTLKLLAANNPKAKAAGEVEHVEVFYNGDLDDLSPSLQEIALESDASRKRLARDLREPYTSGRVNDTLRIDGNPLLSGQAVVRVYITTDVPAGIGDKGVFGNQLKTIFGRVMTGVNETVSGEKIDATFSYRSLADRIVLSPELMGTTNTLLKIIGQKAAALYRGKK